MKSRFAPSPTGCLHIGGARTALFAWVWAKKQHGKFVLRIEDTDLERSNQASVDAILQGMNWLGLDYDEGPFYQTDRFNRYKQVVRQLLDEKKAYYCECSKERLQILHEDLIKQGKKVRYDGCCRDKNLNDGVVRFNNPEDGLVIFNDVIKGQISINNKELDDLIIVRSDGTPTYNLTVVVDDHDMQIDCVIRGDDHINNTPKQINLYQALGWHLPEFAHLPMILSSDGARLSKRHDAVSIMTYRDAGFLPEALLNYLARLGWSYGDQEIFSMDEIVKLFELKSINKAPASFNQDKLLWLNQKIIKNSSVENLLNNLTWHLQNQAITITNAPNIEAVVQYLQNRCKTLVDMAGEVKMFYQDFDTFDEKLAKRYLKDKTPLKHLFAKLEALRIWKANNIKQAVKEVCFELNISFGKVGQPFRLALSGNGNAGSIDIVAELVGKNKALSRLKMAIDS
ncbi:glutamyl-tRNA synthetase [Candidatus Ruthia magnifica str. Cm (Calyptogena magnifica)]|uniref:Glutamate--tRNA ligase n=1 Tax=Ruthia magnifica subsp. Calyptogena magnifica TaxID=413404 RepID=SYE_RUTMC|nr:glutamate--tRNA ligase [Candidatus Ruthturnera calyptogenae]A1AWC3.1 RecName: Full=Glutamate--tRNA ligase; AltName: Full=Glutamyl-tRNA synthetase; Short=GluRS [Candidatus Ruthia magnifica str. Cm (Calyptogena magnifica)]ABL02230.1 glutamyl-tRNA synthetase [Candidatus Ruthia magnifica str. Cm (Calyptogena magnifica)]